MPKDWQKVAEGLQQEINRLRRQNRELKQQLAGKKMTFNRDNERPDMQLEHDRSEGIKRDNWRKNFDKPIPEANFSETGKPVSEIVQELVAKGGGSALYFKEQICWDMGLREAAVEACLAAIVPEGWDTPLVSSENITVDSRDTGHQFQIYVELFPESEGE